MISWSQRDSDFSNGMTCVMRLPDFSVMPFLEGKKVPTTWFPLLLLRTILLETVS